MLQTVGQTSLQHVAYAVAERGVLSYGGLNEGRKWTVYYTSPQSFIFFFVALTTLGTFIEF